MKKLYGFDVDGTLIAGFLETTTCEACDGSGRVPDHEGAVESAGLAFPKPTRPCGPCKGKGQHFGKHLPYEIVNTLPGRRELLFRLASEGASFFLATNQGGVALGYQRASEVYTKLGKVSSEFENFYARPTSVHIAFGHKDAKDAYWRREDMLRLRKPDPGMIEDAMRAHGVTADETVYVGDLATDRDAATAAGVDFAWAEDFFSGGCWRCHGDTTITVNPSLIGDPQQVIDVPCPECV